MTERFLVTGAFGCIGSWTVKRLLEAGEWVGAFDLAGEPHRLRLILSDQELSAVNITNGDITDLEALEQLIIRERITHIIHLAALQVPFVKADPVRGARVNVVGTTVVLEVARRNAGLVRGVVYTSSAAVWGHARGYGAGPIPSDAVPEPLTLYGVFKYANEGTARIYWDDWSLPSIGLRPYVVYGPGRDQGMTSPPTKAILAAAAGRPYQIKLGGAWGMQYAGDVAELFIRAARASSEAGVGAPVVDLGGLHIDMHDWIDAIAELVPSSKGMITLEAHDTSNVEIAANASEDLLGTFSWTPIMVGIAQTLEIFRRGMARGIIDVDRVLG